MGSMLAYGKRAFFMINCKWEPHMGQSDVSLSMTHYSYLLHLTQEKMGSWMVVNPDVNGELGGG